MGHRVRQEANGIRQGIGWWFKPDDASRDPDRFIVERDRLHHPRPPPREASGSLSAVISGKLSRSTARAAEARRSFMSWGSLPKSPSPKKDSALRVICGL